MGIRILLAEDDENIRNTVKAFLTEAGYLVDACIDGDDALTMMYSHAYQLAIFDIMLPGTDGHGLLREFRRLGSAPVMMMTALSDDGSQIRAFDAEADDYVTKPFRIQLLLRRVEALLRRSGALAKEIRFSKLALRIEDFKAYYSGAEVPLTLKEFEILLLLLRHTGKTLSYDAILSRIWGYDFDGGVGVVHTHIKNLRSKLPENIIENVRGVGYRIDEVRQ